jgi:hypothetical protein
MQHGNIQASLSHEIIPHAFFVYGLIFLKENQMVLSFKFQADALLIVVLYNLCFKGNTTVSVQILIIGPFHVL